MAWVSGIPTLALFGSSRSDWARPLGARAAFLDAEVLECAPCMLETCRLGDTRCMSLHTPEKVIATALRLLE
jgi:ADP-heptose:LPS heptosyltransferase